jgi:hypothetical protein
VKPIAPQQFTAYVGIDWADLKHDVCLQPAGSEQREFDCFAHKVDCIDQWAHSLHRLLQRSRTSRKTIKASGY